MSRSPLTRHAAIDADKLALARRFRRHPTPVEAVAWSLLRDRKLLGLKFRRQQLVAGFVVDFYCAELRLVLELDGGVHDDPARATYDAVRTQRFSSLAITVLRVRNADLSERFLRERLAPLARRGPSQENGTSGAAPLIDHPLSGRRR